MTVLGAITPPYFQFLDWVEVLTRFRLSAGAKASSVLVWGIGMEGSTGA
jgi:hypothetical protein